jgi:hypothetical protein
VLPSIEQTEPARTLIVPRVGPPATRSRLRFLLPWLVFGAVAVVVVVGTSLWSVALRTSATSRAAPDAAGIDTGVAPGPPSVAALPTTPVTATVTTAAAFTAVRSPVPRPRAAAPPPAPALPAAVAPTSVVPPPDPAPMTLSGLAVCAEPDAEPPACTATSAPALRSAARAAGTMTTKRTTTDTT